MKQLTFTMATLLSLSFSVSAAITWTGASDSSLTNDANWDFSAEAGKSSLGDFTGLITNGSLEVDVMFNNAGTNPEIGNLGSQPAWGIASGFTMTIDGVGLNTVAGGNDGVGVGNINVINGGSIMAFFTRGNVTVDGTSSLNLLGGGTPINPAGVTLAAGAQLTLVNTAEFTEQGSRIFVNGVSYATDNSILSFSGNTATAVAAVPEPSSTALLGLGGLALMLRRKK